jgi:hypothetical protein
MDGFRENFWGSIKTSWWLKKTILKNTKVNGKDDIPYMKWKIKFMFETTNQKRSA